MDLSPPLCAAGLGEQWAGLPVGSVVLGSFVEAAGRQTQQNGAAQGGIGAARDREVISTAEEWDAGGTGSKWDEKWSTSAQVVRPIFVLRLISINTFCRCIYRICRWGEKILELVYSLSNYVWAGFICPQVNSLCGEQKRRNTWLKGIDYQLLNWSAFMCR